MLPGWPDLPPLFSLLVTMAPKQTSNSILEEERGTLQTRVKLTIDKDTGIQIFLSSVAKVLVFIENPLEK
jgi:hypothetical protein